MSEQSALCLMAPDDLCEVESATARRLDLIHDGDARAHRRSLRRHDQLAVDGRRPDRAPPPDELSPDPIGRHAPLGLPCQAHDPELWFAEAPGTLELAKALCAGCPALQMCLAGALDRREPYGVWGGQIFQQGQIVSHKRPRGRPRKDSIPVSVWA